MVVAAIGRLVWAPHSKNAVVPQIAMMANAPFSDLLQPTLRKPESSESLRFRAGFAGSAMLFTSGIAAGRALLICANTCMSEYIQSSSEDMDSSISKIARLRRGFFGSAAARPQHLSS